MRTRPFSVSALSLAATVLTLIAVSPGSAAASDEGPRITAFDRRVAGSYVMDIGFQGLFLRALVTFVADGNFSMEDTSDHGGVPPGIPPLQSGQRGAWQHTGHHQATFLSVGFDFDKDGNFISLSRHRGTAKFDARFESFSVEGFVDVFLNPAADPVNDEPDFSLPWTATAHRIPARLQ